MLFFDTINKITLQAYTDAYLYGLGGFYYSGVGSWNCNIIDQANTFGALIERKQLPLPLSRKLSQDPNDPSINVYEVEAILLLFQTWAPYWHRHRIIIHIDSSTAYSGLLDLTLRGPANALFREIFLIAAKWDIVI